MPEDSDFVYRVLIRRGLALDDASAVQLHFELAVLDRYRDAPGYSLIRSNSVGRLRKEGDWSIDFGISPDEALLHASFQDLARLPEADREHWASFATSLPASKMFLQMRLAPSACYDDGDTRQWK